MIVRLIFSLMLVCVAVPAQADDYQYRLGSWDITMQMADQEGVFQPLPRTAMATTSYLEDGKTLQTLFTIPGRFYSVTIAAFDQTEGKWRSFFINARAQRFHSFMSENVDGKMITVIPGGYSGQEPFTVKAVETPVSADEFHNDIFHQANGAQEWKHVYKMIYRRRAGE